MQSVVKCCCRRRGIGMRGDIMNSKKNGNLKQNEFGVVLISTFTNEITIAFKVPVDENGVPKELTQGDVVLLSDFIRCFHFQPIWRDNKFVLCLENPVVFDDALKNNIIVFAKKYSGIFPQLRAVPSRLNKIKVGAPIVIANLEVKHNQRLMMEMLNRLSGMQGMNMLSQDFFEFLEKYDCHSVGDKQHTLIGHKNRAERVCRWCGKTQAGNATFKKKGHAISESLGNKSIILCDECDACNELFGRTIEEVAATYYSFENALFGIHGKNGIPKVKSSDHESIENNGCSCMSVKAATFEQNGNNPPMQVTIKAPKKIVEQDVYRCFCKYALSCCDEDIFMRFKHLVPWLRKEVDYDKTPWVLAYRHPNLDVETGDRMEQPIMNMYIRRDNDNTMPYFICELQHTIRTHVFIVPRDNDERIRFSSREACIAVWRKLPFIKEKNWENIYDMSGTTPHDYQCVINLVVKTPLADKAADCCR